jgi:hypothetical protein
MRILCLLPFCVLLVATSCSRDGSPSVVPLSDSDVDAVIAGVAPALSYHDDVKNTERVGYEGTKWVATNGNFAPFGSNHFETRAAAVKYMRDLYRLGATAVYVVDIQDDPRLIKSEGGPYSDSLYVFLPPSGARRHALFELEAKEAQAQGFVGSEDTGQKWLLLWMHE